MPFRLFIVILTNTVVTSIIYYLVMCHIAQFVERLIGIGAQGPKISRNLPNIKGTHRDTVFADNDHTERSITRTELNL